MSRFFRTPVLLFLFACSLFAAPEYLYRNFASNPPAASDWTINGSVATTSTGIYSTAANGASLISKAAVPDGTHESEIYLTATPALAVGAAAGNFILYLQATPSALLGPTSQGEFIAFQIGIATTSPFWVDSLALIH